MGENWVTLEALAGRWGVPEDVLLDLAGEGQIPSEHVGRLRFYPESAVAVYAESKGLAINEYPEQD